MARKIMSHEEKIAACKLTLVSGGNHITYDVKSPSGETYRVVSNPSGNVTCNCACGRHRHNSPCAHAERVRQELQVSAPEFTGAPLEYPDAPLFFEDDETIYA